MVLTEPKLPVAIYARYSSDHQDARSIDDQVRRCRAHAAAQGHVVVAEFSDAAVTGAHGERADLRRLLAAVRSKGGSPFRAVFVDDLSRLSRDLGDTWQIVFRDLASADVKVVDVMTGLASDGPGARLTFGALALVNDTFLQLVRTETHRGLEGRALGGFWTGGRCFGFRSVQEENPPDLEHPRKRVVVEAEEAAVVARVFRLFAEGVALKKIAGLLNEDGVQAPNDGGRGNKNGRGWGHTTVRAMLSNERYLGRSIWNQSRWVRVPGRKTRRRVVRPKTEWIVRENPDLAIVSQELWDVVQARFAQPQGKARGRPPGTGKNPSLVTGLLRCGTCGGSMTVVSRKKKAGVSYGKLGCTAHSSRGSAICPNSMTISEKKASRSLVDALREKIDRPELIERFVDTFKERVAMLDARRNSDAEESTRRFRECERHIANLTEAIAKVGWSASLGEKLRDEEMLLGKLKSERSSPSSTAGRRIVPEPGVIAGYLRNLFPLLEIDPVRGREILSRFLAPVVMTPKVEGPNRHYLATGAFDLSFLVSAAHGGDIRVGKSGCAGAIPMVGNGDFRAD
jgi:DNA invertase Pin-like site-specific DNA recombinase